MGKQRRTPREEKDHDLRKQRRFDGASDKGVRKTRRRLKASDRRRQRRACDVALERALDTHADGDMVDFDIAPRAVDPKWSGYSGTVSLGAHLEGARARRAWREAWQFIAPGYEPERDRERFECYVRQLVQSRSPGTVEVARAFARAMGYLPFDFWTRWASRNGRLSIDAFLDDVPELREPFEAWIEAQLALGDALTGRTRP